MILAERQHQVL